MTHAEQIQVNTALACIAYRMPRGRGIVAAAYAIARVGLARAEDEEDMLAESPDARWTLGDSCVLAAEVSRG